MSVNILFWLMITVTTVIILWKFHPRRDSNYISEEEEVLQNLIQNNESLSQIETSIRQNTESIRQNTELIRQNTESIRQNSESLRKNNESLRKTISEINLNNKKNL